MSLEPGLDRGGPVGFAVAGALFMYGGVVLAMVGRAAVGSRQVAT
jgi:hypothetical protein